MKIGRLDQAVRPRRRRSRPPRKALALHPLFVPLLAGWGAVCAAMIVLVLPQTLIAQVGHASGLGSLARPALALLAALLGAGGCALTGAALAARATVRVGAPSLAAAATRWIRPIDPARDLGTESLDAPIETMPFAADPLEPAPATSATDWIGDDEDEALFGFASSDEPDRAAEDASPPAPAPVVAGPAPVEPAHDLPPPRALDLAEFAELPGRNAVWVEAPRAPRPVPASDAAPATGPDAHRLPAAVARLRAVPPGELSMVQMVERFAAALHERQDAAARQGEPRRGLPGREAELAAALKALAVLSEGRAGREGPDDDDLHAALRRLQQLRGAA